MLMNITKSIACNYEQSHGSNCTNFTRDFWKYYADNSGIMITYPYYRGDPVYEHDQCTNNKILYDPRIKPVSEKPCHLNHFPELTFVIASYIVLLYLFSQCTS